MDQPQTDPRKVPTRAREGRWLGGVCAALAAAGGLKLSWVRLAFVAASLIGMGAIA